MSNDSIPLLQNLLKQAEIEKERKRDITIPVTRISGYPFRDAMRTQELHSTLKLAVDAGAIRVEWAKHYEDHEIERIRLLDVRKLAEFLGQPFLPDAINSFFDSLDTNDFPEWGNQCLDKVRVSWIKGKSSFGLKWENRDQIPDLIKAVTMLENSPLTETMDYRQFGARVLGNSKRPRIIEKSLTALYRHHWQQPDRPDRDIMQELNIVPMAHPILISGPVCFHHGNDQLKADVTPYIGIHDTWLTEFTIPRQPAYILTIENLSSFNEYTTSIQDGGLVFYTGGFPTSVLQNFYKRLIATINCDTYHWGDIDPHGFWILRTLQQNAGKKVVLPHLMDQDYGEKYSPGQIKDLKRISPVNPTVDELLGRLAQRGYGLLEQEEIRAVAP